MNERELADALTELGWKKHHLAFRLGVHQNTVTSWFMADRNPSGPPEYVAEYLRVCLLAKAALR